MKQTYSLFAKTLENQASNVFFLNKIYQWINSYILKYINELWGKKTSRELIFEANSSSLVIVSKADTFDNKAQKEKET